MSSLASFSFRASTLLLASQMAVTKVFAGSALGTVPAIPGTPGTITDAASVKALILSIVVFVLNFLALLAVVFILYAGFRLVTSGGNEEAKNKAKTTIIYVILGLLVVLFARAIVSFFVEAVPAAI